MNWLDDATEMLERMTNDPMAGAVRGTLRVVEVSSPRADGGRYQDCRYRAVVEAAGIAPAEVSSEGVFDRTAWPTVGLVVPARISPSDPSRFEADWNAALG